MYYRGMEQLRAFYNSCMTNRKEHNRKKRFDDLLIPVGITSTFILFIIGMFLPFGMGFGLCKLAMVIGFGSLITKAVRITKQSKEEIQRDDINYGYLRNYFEEAGRSSVFSCYEHSYCLSGDDTLAVKKEFKGDKYFALIFIGGLALFGILFCYFAFGEEWGLDVQTGGTYIVFVACAIVTFALGIRTLVMPITTIITHPVKIPAVCVEVDSYQSGGEYHSRTAYFAIVEGKDYIYFDKTNNNLHGDSVGDVRNIRVARNNPYHCYLGFSYGKFMFGICFFLPFGAFTVVLFLLITGLLH